MSEPRLQRRALLLGALALPLQGCSPGNKAGREIDAGWHRQALIEGHLSRWLAASPTPSGMFLTRLDRNWKPLVSDKVELTLQARLIYAMVNGYELTQDPRYLDAAQRGTDFLLERCHDSVHGGFFNVVAADGQVFQDKKRSYGQAFALLALSHMARVTKQQRYKTAALQCWRDVELGLRDPAGGLFDERARNFTGGQGARTQNPVMHMFEASLALDQATGDAQARAGARSIGDFVVYKLLEGLPDGSARINEWYDQDWQALPTRDKGGYVELGHQFEWSHLLLSAGQQGISPVYGAVADRILQYALKAGYDEIDGGCYNRAYPDAPTDKEKFWWQQAECLHALVTHAASSGRNELWRRYDQTLDLIKNELIDPEHGGWRGGSTQTCMHGSGCPDEQPEPYHMTSMHRAAIAAAGA